MKMTATHMPTFAARSLVACLLIAAFALGSRNAAAGEISTTIDECHPPEPIPIPPYSGTVAFSNGHPGVTTESTYGPGIENYECTVVTVTDFNNNPDAPTGTTSPFQTTDPALVEQYLLNLIKSNLTAPIINQDATPTHLFETIPDAVTGVRGSLDAIDGWVLTTASPAYLSFLTEPFADAAYVPFVINGAAPGDSLSIYGPGGVLWSQPLADFTLGDLYFAEVPAQPGEHGAPVALTYYLHNDTESQHSSVWFPEDITLTSDATSVPEPSTLSLVGLGFFALALTRRKRKQA